MSSLPYNSFNYNRGSVAYAGQFYRSFYSETGSPWYEANSTQVSMPNHRCSTGPYGTSSSNSGGNRWETNVGSSWNDVGFEVVCYLKIKNQLDDGHIGLKHGGPNHTPPCDYQYNGSCCCWWDGGMRNYGTSYLEIERPHPHNYNRSYFSSMGRKIDNGSMLGVRWSLKKLSAYHTRRLRFWVDTSGGRNYKWRKMYDYTDSGGKMPQSYAITSNQNIEMRISDVTCHDIDMLYGPYAKRMA